MKPLAVGAALAACLASFGCDQASGVADAVITSVAASPCKSPDIEATIVENSGFYVSDGIRGAEPIAGVSVSFSSPVKQDEKSDRIVCKGTLRIQGERAFLALTALNAQWSTDPSYLTKEALSGWMATPSDLYKEYQSGPITVEAAQMMAMMVAMTSFKADMDTSAMSYSTSVEYAITKTTPAELIGWGWNEGQTPGYKAGMDLHKMFLEHQTLVEASVETTSL